MMIFRRTAAGVPTENLRQIIDIVHERLRRFDSALTCPRPSPSSPFAPLVVAVARACAIRSHAVRPRSSSPRPCHALPRSCSLLALLPAPAPAAFCSLLSFAPAIIISIGCCVCVLVSASIPCRDGSASAPSAPALFDGTSSSTRSCVLPTALIPAHSSRLLPRAVALKAMY